MGPLSYHDELVLQARYDEQRRAMERQEREAMERAEQEAHDVAMAYDALIYALNVLGPRRVLEHVAARVITAPLPEAQEPF
jgi:hypothetical protein